MSGPLASTSSHSLHTPLIHAGDETIPDYSRFPRPSAGAASASVASAKEDEPLVLIDHYTVSDLTYESAVTNWDIRAKLSALEEASRDIQPALNPENANVIVSALSAIYTWCRQIILSIYNYLFNTAQTQYNQSHLARAYNPIEDPNYIGNVTEIRQSNIPKTKEIEESSQRIEALEAFIVGCGLSEEAINEILAPYNLEVKFRGMKRNVTLPPEGDEGVVVGFSDFSSKIERKEWEKENSAYYENSLREGQGYQLKDHVRDLIKNPRFLEACERSDEESIRSLAQYAREHKEMVANPTPFDSGAFTAAEAPEGSRLRRRAPLQPAGVVKAVILPKEGPVETTRKIEHNYFHSRQITTAIRAPILTEADAAAIRAAIGAVRA